MSQCFLLWLLCTECLREDLQTRSLVHPLSEEECFHPSERQTLRRKRDRKEDTSFHQSHDPHRTRSCYKCNLSRFCTCGTNKCFSIRSIQLSLQSKQHATSLHSIDRTLGTNHETSQTDSTPQSAQIPTVVSQHRGTRVSATSLAGKISPLLAERASKPMVLWMDGHLHCT
jgi:hypothetical protein